MKRLKVSQCVSKPSPSLICPICQDVFMDPFITNQCHHTFCNDCLVKAIEFESKCPLCRTTITLDDYHSNLALKSLVAEIPVFCTHREEGCSIIIPFESLNFHVQNECELVVRYCVCHPEGCNFKGTSSERQLHLETCVFYKLRSFISVTNRRLEQLEATVLTQQKMILDLQQQKTIKTLNNNTRIESRELDIPPMTCIKTISNIGTGITSVTHLDDTYIAGCYDGTIRTFDSMSGISGTVGFGHQLSVWSLALDLAGNKLFSGASDGNINSWSLSNSRVNLEQTVKIGNGKVYSLAVHNDLLFAGSSDGRVHIMNHKLGSVGSLVGHSGGINSVHIANNLVLTASSDKSIKIWDLATSKCLQTLSMHTSEVLDVHTRSNLLFGSTYGADIVVYDMNDYSKVKTLTGHRWEVWKLESSENVLYSGSHDHTIRRWDIRNLQLVDVLTGHQGYIHALSWGPLGLVSGGADRSIKTWA